MKFELQPTGLNLESIAKAKSPARISKNPDEKKPGDDTFSKLLAAADTIAQESDKAGAGLMSGQMEIHEAMVRMEKADLMLKLGTNVRNKLLDAYQQLLSSAGT